MRDECETLALCGYFLHELGAYADAEARLLEMVAIGERIGSARDICYSQLYLGSTYARCGRADDAERALGKAMVACVRLGQPSFHAEALGHLAGLQLARGAIDDARASIAQGLSLETDMVEAAARAYLTARASSASLQEGTPIRRSTKHVQPMRCRASLASRSTWSRWSSAWQRR